MSGPADANDKRDSAAEGAERAPRRRPALPQRARSRRFMLWTLVPLCGFLLFTALILATGTPSSAELMKQATTSFGEVKRGTFSFEISITPKGQTAAEPSTIRLAGPFEILPGKRLPLAHINYTISAGGRSQNIELLTTGDKAYTVIKGQAYELPKAATDQLAKATKDISKDGKGKQSTGGGLIGLKLNFSRWLINPQVGSGAEIDGTPTWRTRAELNVVAALKDLTNSARALGSVTGTKVPQLREKDLKEIRKGIKNARVEVFVGRYDRIVRKVDLTMDFVTPSELTAAAGGMSGGRMHVVIGIKDPNEPVNVKPPANPLPYKALESLSQTSQSGTALDDGVGR